MTTLAIDDITPERILAAAEKAGLKLIPGDYITYGDYGQPIGCCPAGALAIEAKGKVPDVGELGFGAILMTAGITAHFRYGLAEGFDGDPTGRLVGNADYDRGFAVGRACRQTADAAGGAR